MCYKFQIFTVINMKKLSKKKRNELRIQREIKEKQIRKRELHEQQVRLSAEKKKSQPWVLKIRTCHHYKGTGGGIVSGCAYTTLYKISDRKCRCINCHKEFPIEFMYKMEKLTENFAFAGCCEVVYAAKKLYAESRPVKYYIDENGHTCYIDENCEENL